MESGSNSYFHLKYENMFAFFLILSQKTSIVETDKKQREHEIRRNYF